MRDWNAAVREHLARHGRVLPTDVIEEIAQHVADLHRGLIFRGETVEEADRLAESELANIDPIVQAIERRRRRLPSDTVAPASASLWTGVGRDVTQALRLLRTKGGYSTVIAATLAIGIGACTAVFSLFNGMLLGPLPFLAPDRLVLAWETPAGDSSRHFVVSAANYQDWAAELRSFESLGLWEQVSFNLSATAQPARVPGIRASASLFDVLGIRAARGRFFNADEQKPGHQVAVITDAVWHAHFAGDPSVIGRTVRLNGDVYEVIGVMPPATEFPQRGIGIWVPLSLRPEENRGWHAFMVAGRLADGVSFERARDEVERLGATLRTRYKENANEGATIELMADAGLANVRRILVVLSAAVGLVLLIACVNVASLQLAFGLSRRREFVTRLSLGARYAHLVRQVIVESAILAAVGCAAGLVIAFVLTRSVDLVMAPDFRTLPFRGEVSIALDARTVLFAVLVSALSALLFALAPLAGLRRQGLQAMLRDGDRGATRGATRTRQALVTAEIALAIIVLCSAGLMVRSLSTLLNVNPGLDPTNVLVMSMSLPQGDPYGPPERRTFCADFAREVQAVPGVLRAGAISHLPLSGANSDRILTIEGRPQPAPTQEPFYADYRIVCGDYFATLGIPLVAGRLFDERDSLDTAEVVVVNRTFVDQYFPGGVALNKRIKLGNPDSGNPWLTIVGVVDNVRHFGLEAAPSREIYRPYTQAASPLMTIVAKTIGDPLALHRGVRDALSRVDPNLPAGLARTMEDVLARSVAWRQTPMRLLTGFAAIALLLATIGVYGVLAYYVSQRTREFGVRIALGASKRTLGMLVVRQSLRPLAAGVFLGIAGSLASGRLMTDLLYEVKPGDPAVVATIVAVLVTASLMSCWLPARRAARVDPVIALRAE